MQEKYVMLHISFRTEGVQQDSKRGLPELFSCQFPTFTSFSYSSSFRSRCFEASCLASRTSTCTSQAVEQPPGHGKISSLPAKCDNCYFPLQYLKQEKCSPACQLLTKSPFQKTQSENYFKVESRFFQICRCA